MEFHINLLNYHWCWVNNQNQT